MRAKEKCSICGDQNSLMYAHCKSCLTSGKPSGIHEVCWDDTWVYVNCASCGELVAQFVKGIKTGGK